MLVAGGVVRSRRGELRAEGLGERLRREAAMVESRVAVAQAGLASKVVALQEQLVAEVEGLRKELVPPAMEEVLESLMAIMTKVEEWDPGHWRTNPLLLLLLVKQAQEVTQSTCHGDLIPLEPALTDREIADVRRYFVRHEYSGSQKYHHGLSHFHDDTNDQNPRNPPVLELLFLGMVLWPWRCTTPPARQTPRCRPGCWGWPGRTCCCSVWRRTPRLASTGQSLSSTSTTRRGPVAICYSAFTLLSQDHSAGGAGNLLPP